MGHAMVMMEDPPFIKERLITGVHVFTNLGDWIAVVHSIKLL
jgi:hypothetical protein